MAHLTIYTADGLPSWATVEADEDESLDDLLPMLDCLAEFVAGDKRTLAAHGHTLEVVR